MILLEFMSTECGAEEVSYPVGERQACGAADHDAQHSAVHVPNTELIRLLDTVSLVDDLAVDA